MVTSVGFLPSAHEQIVHDVQHCVLLFNGLPALDCLLSHLKVLKDLQHVLDNAKCEETACKLMLEFLFGGKKECI